jgi:hypothetical protein
VKQMNQGIFVHQAKYTKDLMKKFNMAELKPVSTLMSSAALLGPDEDGEAVGLASDRLTTYPLDLGVGVIASSFSFLSSSAPPKIS